MMTSVRPTAEGVTEVAVAGKPKMAKDQPYNRQQCVGPLLYLRWESLYWIHPPGRLDYLNMSAGQMSVQLHMRKYRKHCGIIDQLSFRRSPVKREVLSELSRLVEDEVHTVCQRIVDETVTRAMQHFVDANKQKEEEERRSALLSGLLGKDQPEVSPLLPVGSEKSHPRARETDGGDAKRWLNLMRENDDSTSVYRDAPGPDYPGLKEIHPINDLFKRALSYKTYRLRNRDAKYDGEVAQQLTKICRRMKHAMPGEEFTGDDEIAVLAFLKKFKYACDETGVAEGAALPLMKYFMGGEAKATMLTYIGLNDIGAQPGVDSINSYPEAVQWLLLTYARESVLHDASREVREMVQGIGEKEQQYAGRLRKAAIRCGDVFREQDLITIYVGGLRPHARYAVRESLSRTDKRTFQQIREHAQSLGDTFREQQRELNKLKSNFPDKKTSSRRASVLTTESGPDEAPDGGEVLAVLADRPSYRSSVSVPTTSGTPTTPGPRSYQAPTLPRGMLKIPSDSGVTTVLPGLKPGESPKFSIGRGVRLKPFYCLLCRLYGHSMVDCDMLTDAQHEQAEVPLTEAERRFLRDVRVALAELRPDAFGSNGSTSNSDSEDDSDPPGPGNGKEERN